MLKSSFSESNLIEAGCDEAGRGCLAGPVVAAAVILPESFMQLKLNDSKKLSPKIREELRPQIKESSVAYATGLCDHKEIDELNILNASFEAVNRALNQLKTKPNLILMDGNRFKNQTDIPHKCIVKGDAIYASIAAASILAKTLRDDIMKELHLEYPVYKWNKNKGYPTLEHREAIRKYGLSPYHRLTFRALPEQLKFIL